MQIGGIILAGGKSSRMKSDKGLLKFRDKYLIEYAIEAATEHCAKVYIVSDNPEYDRFGLPRFEDIIPDMGPLGGIKTGLKLSDYEYNIVLSCDLPLIEPYVVKELIRDTDEELVKIASCEGQLHPLVGLYSKWVLPTLDQYLIKGNRSVMDFVNSKEATQVEFSSDHAYQFTNVNTESEFQNL